MVIGLFVRCVLLGLWLVVGVVLWSLVGVVNDDVDLGWFVGIGGGFVGVFGWFDKLVWRCGCVVFVLVFVFVELLVVLGFCCGWLFRFFW